MSTWLLSVAFNLLLSTHITSACNPSSFRIIRITVGSVLILTVWIVVAKIEIWNCRRGISGLSTKDLGAGRGCDRREIKTMLSLDRRCVE